MVQAFLTSKKLDLPIRIRTPEAKKSNNRLTIASTGSILSLNNQIKSAEHTRGRNPFSMSDNPFSQALSKSRRMVVQRGPSQEEVSESSEERKS